MEAQNDSFEIVSVIRGFKLIDAISHERRYWRRYGLPLVRGYYVVRWPGGATVRRFNAEAEFYGPFRFREDAHAALKRFQTTGRAKGFRCIASKIHSGCRAVHGNLRPVCLPRSKAQGKAPSGRRETWLPLLAGGMPQRGPQRNHGRGSSQNSDEKTAGDAESGE
jgi:hypothetical protein